MNLEEFMNLSEDEAVFYDLKNESPSINVRKESHPVKKFLLYKLDYPKTKFDCDSKCQLVKEIYSKLYPQKNLDYLDFDTMNSFYTTYRELLIKEDKIFWKNNFPPKETDYQKLLSERMDWLLTDNVFQQYASINNHDEVKRFATLTHTIGNMILLPKGYNKGRISFSKDYWDLTFLSLREFLGDSFQNYVNDYYLQDFVEKPIEYWEGHSIKKPLPQSTENVFVFLQTVNKKIEERGRRIFQELKKLFK